jgi:hypothetical protein
MDTTTPQIQTKTTSRQWLLNAEDFIRGLVIAIISAVLTAIAQSLSAGHIHIDWNAIESIAATTASGYWLMHLAKPSQTIVTNPEDVAKVNAAVAQAAAAKN